MLFLFCMISRFSMFLKFSYFLMFSMFSIFVCCFLSFPFTAITGFVAGARLTAFPEARLMRCVAHGSNLCTMRVPTQLPEKPSYQRWTRLQPTLETPTKSYYDRTIAPADF